MNELVGVESIVELRRRWESTAEGRRLSLELGRSKDLEPIVNATGFSVVLRLNSIREESKMFADPKLAERVAVECDEIAKELRLLASIAIHLIHRNKAT